MAGSAEESSEENVVVVVDHGAPRSPPSKPPTSDVVPQVFALEIEEEQTEPLDLSLNRGGCPCPPSANDDVIFVTAYSAPTKGEDKAPSGGVATRRRRRKRLAVVPRRNPKRVAQMEKASVDLAMKLSMPRRIFGARTSRSATTATTTVNVGRNCRQSCRTTGAILSPPRALRKEDWKEWPSEGLHERPFYNTSTKLLHRFDRNMKFVKELERSVAGASSENNGRQKLKPDEELEILTHKSLHATLRYVSDVKLFNCIKREANASCLGDFWRMNGSDDETNVSDACDLLLDTSRLYCLCNNVTEKNMVRYLDTLSAGNLRRFDENKENYL